jgi:hypothetical protein
VTVSVTGDGAGTVSSVGGISCGQACSATAAQGTSLTVTATPAEGSVFAGWDGACTGSAATCTVTVSSATSITGR